MVATLIVVPCTCHDLHDPGISERRAAHTGISAGRTQHKVVCAPGMSLLGSGDPCGNARGRQAKKRPCDRFVTMFPWHLFGLSQSAPSARPIVTRPLVFPRPSPPPSEKRPSISVTVSLLTPSPRRYLRETARSSRSSATGRTRSPDPLQK